MTLIYPRSIPETSRRVPRLDFNWCSSRPSVEKRYAGHHCSCIHLSIDDPAVCYRRVNGLRIKLDRGEYLLGLRFAAVDSTHVDGSKIVLLFRFIWKISSQSILPLVDAVLCLLLETGSQNVPCCCGCSCYQRLESCWPTVPVVALGRIHNWRYIWQFPSIYVYTSFSEWASLGTIMVSVKVIPKRRAEVEQKKPVLL